MAIAGSADGDAGGATAGEAVEGSIGGSGEEIEGGIMGMGKGVSRVAVSLNARRDVPMNRRCDRPRPPTVGHGRPRVSDLPYLTSGGS
jgi:hypothetical protein